MRVILRKKEYGFIEITEKKDNRIFVRDWQSKLCTPDLVDLVWL